jgi:hypothetical protein
MSMTGNEHAPASLGGLASRRLRLTRPGEALLGSRGSQPMAVDRLRLARPRGALAVSRHGLTAEVELGLVLIVSPSAKLDLVRVVIAPASKRVSVVVLELTGIGAGAAPPRCLVHKGALSAIALEDRAPDRGRDVARARRRVGVLQGLLRLVSRAEASALQLAEEQLHGLVHDLGQIAIRALVAKQD